MVKNFALPAATSYKDRRALRGLDTAFLCRLADECESWFAGTLDLGATLETVAAKIEWKALIERDASDVCAAHARLREEIEARESRLHRLREAKARKRSSPEEGQSFRQAAE